jgi:hypothetical protein
MQRTRHATWHHGRGPNSATAYYVVRNRGGGYWYSIDGDTWTNASGEPVDTPAFRAATIVMHGGPRDGQYVS